MLPLIIAFLSWRIFVFLETTKNNNIDKQAIVFLKPESKNGSRASEAFFTTVKVVPHIRQQPNIAINGKYDLLVCFICNLRKINFILTPAIHPVL